MPEGGDQLLFQRQLGAFPMDGFGQDCASTMSRSKMAGGSCPRVEGTKRRLGWLFWGTGSGQFSTHVELDSSAVGHEKDLFKKRMVFMKNTRRTSKANLGFLLKLDAMRRVSLKHRWFAEFFHLSTPLHQAHSVDFALASKYILREIFEDWKSWPWPSGWATESFSGSISWAQGRVPFDVHPSLHEVLLHLREDWSSFPVLIPPVNHVLVIFGQDSDVVCTFFEQKGFLGTVDFRILGAGFNRFPRRNLVDSVTYSVQSAPFPDFAASFLPATPWGTCHSRYRTTLCHSGSRWSTTSWSRLVSQLRLNCNQEWVGMAGRLGWPLEISLESVLENTNPWNHQWRSENESETLCD